MSKDKIQKIDGFEILTTNIGIKPGNKKNDFTLIKIIGDSVVSGVFTKNKFAAAPVIIAKENIKNNIKLIVINSGNANAGTGKKGISDAKKINHELSKYLNISPNQVLPFSTGVIMQYLPVEKIIKKIKMLDLDKSLKNNWFDAARAIMTTDTVQKISSACFKLAEEKISVTGIAKGSGMINPNMATMLGFIAMDVRISKRMLNALVKEVADESFNLITVDGDTSTNDAFIIASSQLAKNNKILTKNTEYKKLKSELTKVAFDLASAIIRDGEGATKFVEIKVMNAKSKSEAMEVGKKIANSPLVKTAFFASDPNLGRILCSIGNASISNLNLENIRLFLNDHLVFEKGLVSKKYKESLALKIMKKKEFSLTVDLKRGKETLTVLTTDFSYEYVKINAEYRS
ncbi:MAG: bifunctional glutamate N-acetyltransferase/amino-acid acetyltransferase ArgJ [Nitrosomonadales bacterium]